jgi:tetratricopeptide (TPR) repeat protein
MFALVKRLVPQPRLSYIGHVKKRPKRALRILFGSIIGLAVFSLLLFLWFKRNPTTQLIDASGKELTAGAVPQGDEEVLGGSLFEEAQALIKRKDFVAAKERLLRVIEESDRDGEACILLCDVSRELKDVATAADYGLKAVELLPGSAEAHLAYAKAQGAQLAADMQSISGMLGAVKRLGLFKAELNRVIELNPQDTEARMMLVFTNLAPKPVGDFDRAIELCGEIEARDPVMGKQLLAMCYQRKKETERAITLLLAGIEEYPKEYSFHVALADIYAEGKRFDAADAEYEAARRGGKDKTYYSSLYSQARMRIQNQFEPERAVELLDEFIADEPEYDTMQTVAHACWRKGNALEQLGRKQDAREAYEESLRRDPGLELAKKAIAGLRE